jgi:hypothetical protein
MLTGIGSPRDGNHRRCTNKIQRNIITERVLELSKESRSTPARSENAKGLADLMAPAGAGGSILNPSTVGQEDTHPWYNRRRYTSQAPRL